MLLHILLFCLSGINAQLFEQNIAGGARSLASSLTLDKKYMYVSGAVGSSDAPNILVSKMNLDGTLLWSRKIISQLNGGEARSVVSLPDGGVAFAGRFGTDACVGRFSASGRLLWAKVFSDGPYSGAAQLMSIVYNDDTLVAVGQIRDGGSQAFILRLHMDGSIIYSNYLDGMSAHLHALTTLPGNGYIAVGRSDQSGIIVKFNEDGSSSWVKTFQLPDSYTVFSAVFRTDDGLYVVGQAYGAKSGFPESIVGRFDGYGNFLWSNLYTIPDTAGMELHSLFVQAGTIVVAGLAQQPYRGVIASISLGGQPITSRLYGSRWSAPTFFSVALAGAQVYAVGNSLVSPATTARATPSSYIIAGNALGETSCPTEARSLAVRPIELSGMAKRLDVIPGMSSASDVSAAVSFPGRVVAVCPAPTTAA
eukprot:TRINITY_DN1761_c0_g1_i1.p1 TRINITY_DN1761_c0_g1~~TRINITY_DN1761_c0_g1_i1.p1  ORF type:complete len:478 (-),score=70.46 TRINITY_DN1761_c0_g1_i1:363-1628(-)